MLCFAAGFASIFVFYNALGLLLQVRASSATPEPATPEPAFGSIGSGSVSDHRAACCTCRTCTTSARDASPHSGASSTPAPQLAGRPPRCRLWQMCSWASALAIN